MSLDGITASTKLACEGSTVPLTTSPIVGSALAGLAEVVRHDAEPVTSGEIRVTILGSGIRSSGRGRHRPRC